MSLPDGIEAQSGELNEATFKPIGGYVNNDNLCSRCGAKNIESDYALCKQCRDYNKEFREERRANHECVQCGDGLPPKYIWDNIRCPECAEKNKNAHFFGEYKTLHEIRTGVDNRE